MNNHLFCEKEIAERRNLPLVNGYDTHRIVTIDRAFTYEQPINYQVRKTAGGGWWGIATFTDGTVLKKFRGKPARIISKDKVFAIR